MGKVSDFFEVEETTLDDVKQKFIDNMDMLKSMDVTTQTLYKKWKEINGAYGSKIDISRVVKAKIWKPTDIMNKEQTIRELENLQPRIRYVVPKSADETDWLMLRVFISSFQFDQNPGRFVKFLVYDEVTGKYLGVVSLGSDVISITCRDEWIGWDKTTKLGGKLNNSAIGTTIVPTQPFGYNFLGGKLVASLLTTKVVSDVWKDLYDDTLVGITTTSLYGGHSMYQRIPFWREMGKSKGAISLKPDDDIYEVWHHYVKEHMADEYNRKVKSKDTTNGPVTGIKQQILSIIFRAVGISPSKYKHGFERGVYYAPLYENTREYLQGKITDAELVPIDKLKDDRDAVLSWWRKKAIARYTKLHDENNLKPDVLFYNDLVGKTWEQVRAQYLNEVGR